PVCTMTSPLVMRSRISSCVRGALSPLSMDAIIKELEKRMNQPPIFRQRHVVHARAFHELACSSSKRNFLAPRPPAYPVSAPSEPRTRWQGKTMHNGL